MTFLYVFVILNQEKILKDISYFISQFLLTLFCYFTNYKCFHERKKAKRKLLGLIYLYYFVLVLLSLFYLRKERKQIYFSRIFPCFFCVFRIEMDGIKVKGKNVPKPIKNWPQCGVRWDLSIFSVLKVFFLPK